MSYLLNIFSHTFELATYHKKVDPIKSCNLMIIPDLPDLTEVLYLLV